MSEEASDVEDQDPTAEQAIQQEHFKKQVFNWDEHIFKRAPPETMAERLEIDPTKSVYTTNQRALDHTENDLSMYYELDQSIVDRLHLTRYAKTRKASQPLDEEWKFVRHFLMIRPPVWELAQKIKGSYGFGEDGNLVGKTVAVMGRRGTGKTAALAYLSQLGMEAGMIVLPTQGVEFTHSTHGFIQKNEESGVFDQPSFAMDWFKWMMDTNPHTLTRVNLKEDYSDIDWNWVEGQVLDEREERVEDPNLVRTLEDLAELGSRSFEMAPILFDKMIEELYRLDAATEPAVMVLVDDMNYWDQLSQFIDPDTILPLVSRKLQFVNAFARLVEQPPSHGTSIFSLTQSGIMHRGPAYMDLCEEVIEVPIYSDDEFVTSIYHYQISNLPEIERHEVTNAYLGEFRALTGKVPREVLKLMTIM